MKFKRIVEFLGLKKLNLRKIYGMFEGLDFK